MAVPGTVRHAATVVIDNGRSCREELLMAKTESTVELKPIEQLAQRVQSLIEMLETTREELKLVLEDNTRLSGELEDSRGKLQAAREQQETQTRETQSERDEIRERITKMLEQIEEISL
jgi:regulator of replication initiation timing